MAIDDDDDDEEEGGMHAYGSRRTNQTVRKLVMDVLQSRKRRMEMDGLLSERRGIDRLDKSPGVLESWRRGLNHMLTDDSICTHHPLPNQGFRQLGPRKQTP